MKTGKNVLKAMATRAIIASAFIGLWVCPLSNVNAQGVGINPSGNSPDPSAMIDVSSSTKGVLISRVALTGTMVAAPITNPANSLLVYNTATTGDVIPGFYYWDATALKWVRLATNVSGTTGNNIGDMQYWNGTSWVILAAGTPGQVLTSTGSGVPAWQNLFASPTATTSAATSIGATGATLNGIVNNNDVLTTVTFEYGVNTSYGNTATAVQSPVIGNADNNLSVIITGLTLGTTYHYRVKAINSFGTAFGNDMTFIPILHYGDTWQGGLVFYIDGTGLHGLVSAPSDQSTATAWSNVTATLVVGTATNHCAGINSSDVCNGCATSTVFGTGLANSKAIVSQSGHTASAACICRNYSNGGFTDWYLPSKDELFLMYTNLKLNGFGGFASNLYWASSEPDAGRAWRCDFFTGNNTNVLDKASTLYVRAVRTF